MPATAATITADGWLTDVDLGDPDLRPELRRPIGFAAVRAVALSADLLMWVADAADGSPSNAAATDPVMTVTGHVFPQGCSSRNSPGRACVVRSTRRSGLVSSRHARGVCGAGRTGRP
jgi:hypothetical protein